MLQGAIRNIRAFAVPGLCSLTRALPPAPCAGAGAAAAPQAPSSRSSVPIDTRRVTGKATAHVPLGSGEPGPCEAAAVMHPRCSIQNKTWVAHPGAGTLWVSNLHLQDRREEQGRVEPGEQSHGGRWFVLKSAGGLRSGTLGNSSNQHAGDPSASPQVMPSRWPGCEERSQERSRDQKPSQGPQGRKHSQCSLPERQNTSVPPSQGARLARPRAEGSYSCSLVCQLVKLTNGQGMWEVHYQLET